MNPHYDNQKSNSYIEKDFFFTGTVKKHKKQINVIKFFFDFYSKIFSFKKKEIIDPKKLQLQRSVDSLLLNNSLKLLGQVFKNGYEATSEQSAKIEKLYDQMITNNESTFNDIFELLSYGVFPQKNNIHKLFFSSIFQIHFNSFIEYHEAKKNLPSIELSVKYLKRTDKKPVGLYKISLAEKSNYILDFIYSYLDNSEQKKELFDNWMVLLKNNPKSNKLISEEWTLIKPYYIFKYDMIASLSLEQSHEILSCFNKLKDSDAKSMILNDFNLFIDNHYRGHVNNLLEDIKTTYSDSTMKNVVHKNVKKDSHLPLQAQETLDSIYSIYSILSQESNKTKDFFYDIQIIIDKHIPSIIEKYTSISPEYRNTLTNRESKTAKELLLESLNNIHQSMIDLHIENNHDKLRDLTVSEKYTKQLVKKNSI